MKGDEIRNVFSECIKSILEIIHKSGEIRTYYDYSLKIDLSARSWYLELEPKIKYPLPLSFENELMRLPIVKKCLELMLKENFPQRIGLKIYKNGKPVPNPNYEPHLKAEILEIMVIKYIEKYGFDFSEEKFEEIYKEMIEYVYSQERELIYVAPLENFDLLGLDEVKVDDYKIRRLDEWEIKALIEFGYFLGPTYSPYHGGIENIYCIERIIRIPKKEGLMFPLPDIDDFLTALRLFKAGFAGFNAILQYPRIWRIAWGVSISDKRTFERSPKYVFEQKNLEPFISFWNKFKNVKNNFPNNIKFSLRWFNKSYKEQEDIDRLLDLAIALEALFNISDRLDLYVSHFIGSSKEERLKISKDIEKLRKIRGAIVHSGYYKCEREFIDLIENYYRLSMQKFLNLITNQSYESIIKSIKESILD
jgi:hypothetical protein